MQNVANFAPNRNSNGNSHSNSNIEANNITRAADINDRATTLQQSFTDNECNTNNELEKASLNTFERRDYANNRYDSGSLSLEKRNTKDTFQARKIDQQKQNNFSENFVVHHVINRGCHGRGCWHSVAKNNNSNKLKKKQEDSFYLAGVNSRCNCSGLRRSTLSGLIELFEQKLQLEEPSVCYSKKSPRLLLKPLSARERLTKTRVNNTTKGIKKLQQANAYPKSKVLRGNKECRMRDIITPVKYQATTSSNSSCSESNSIEFEYVQKQNQNQNQTQAQAQNQTALEGNRNHNNQNNTQTCNKSLHHVAIKGVPVFPKPYWEQKLTKTRWQPPTDGRQYGQKQATLSRNNYSRLSKQVETEKKAAEELEDDIEYASDSSSQKTILNADDVVAVENQIKASDKPKVSRSISATLAATRGPSIVKHQTSSSRRLLNQLARLRRLNEPLYRIKRPEKVAEVEKIIERLEKATQEWEDDEHLLDRAEQRDWPLEYHTRFPKDSHQEVEVEESEFASNRLSDNTLQRGDGIEDFGRRLDVNHLEQDTIARSHYNYNMATANNYIQTGSQSANSTLTHRALRRSRAFADRYMDDLAVRRLSCGKQTLAGSNSSIHPQNINQPQMSYLLCSNAYTPSIDTNLHSAYEKLDQRVRNDDLHYRNVKNKLESQEPPFGIPRQFTTAASHSSASHYLHRQGNARTPTTTTTCSCVYNSNNEQCCQQISAKRSDSKVSFNEIVDRASGSASVDSGLVAGSPYSAGRQSSVTPRLTPSSSPLVATDDFLNRRVQMKSPNRETPIGQYMYEDDVTQEIDLDEELAKGGCERNQLKVDLKHSLSICESPILERYRAELRATPIRRRPKINIENPRAKSPLLRVSSKAGETRPTEESIGEKSIVELEQEPKIEIQPYEHATRKKYLSRPTSESECKYDFQDEDEDGNEELEDKCKFVQNQSSRIVSTNYDTSDSSSINEAPSNVNLDYRCQQNRTNLDTQPKEQRDKSGPSFSIGEYKPLIKPNLKIL